MLPILPTQTYSQSFKSTFLNDLNSCFSKAANFLTNFHPQNALKLQLPSINFKPSDISAFSVSHESLSAFSNSVTLPLFDASVIYTVLFGTYNLGKRIQGINPNDNRITVSQAVVAGACSGLAVSSFLAPIDLTKGRLAIDGTRKKTNPLSIIRLTRRIVNAHGLRALYQGNMRKTIREVRSGATYFGCYEYLRKKLHSAYGNQNFIPFIAGGTAGFVSWLASYPPSLIKVYRHFEECTQNNYLQNRIMLRGFGVFSSATKAIIIEAVTYLLYPNANKPKY